jgi:hypothetical protein
MDERSKGRAREGTVRDALLADFGPSVYIRPAVRVFTRDYARIIGLKLPMFVFQLPLFILPLLLFGPFRFTRFVNAE